MPELARVALKIQRRRYARTALREVDVHERIQAAGPCAEIAGLREAFVFDGHICMAYERHGRSLESALDRGPLPVARARRVTRQLLVALDRLHGCGLAHTDVKPDNILYDARRGTARLADLGSAREELRQGSRPGTREYFSPEIIIGAPLTWAIDLWSLGCTVFEMLTGHTLFLPYRAAAQKYREFNLPAAALPRDARVALDEAEEAAEQFSRGTIVARKYRLQRVLGQGRFATVWAAQEIVAASRADSVESLRAFARRVAAPDAPEDARDQADRAWRRARGADDLLDLALNYEHLCLIAKLLGPWPQAWVDAGRFRDAYFEANGELRFRPALRRRSLRERLRRGTALRGRHLDLAEDFLAHLLPIPAGECPSARTLLDHPWLVGRDSRNFCSLLI